MMKVKTSFVMPSMTCGTEGRKSRRVEDAVRIHISQPIAASTRGIGPRTKYVVLPAGEGGKRTTEACDLSVENVSYEERHNYQLSAQCRWACNWFQRVFSTNKPSGLRSWP